MRRDKAQFLVLHPPYDDIIKFSDKKEDLSNCATTEEFYDLFEKVIKYFQDHSDVNGWLTYEFNEEDFSFTAVEYGK
mgnify:CR=1 FL=1